MSFLVAASISTFLPQLSDSTVVTRRDNWPSSDELHFGPFSDGQLSLLWEYRQLSGD
jgi:hypothetical protein